MKNLRLLSVFMLACLGVQAQLPWLHVDGNRIRDVSGNAVTLRGVSILAPEHNNECTTCATKSISELLSWEADAGRGWNSRVVRLQVTCAKVSDPAQSFANLIDPYVQQAIAKGLYIIVDLHEVSNYGSGGVPQVFVMNFWKYVAPRYANVPNVLFEVYNEPINPDVWATWKSYIQPVVDTIRSLAPNNLILIGGPQWSTRVNSAAANPLTGANLVYVYHIYPNQGAATPANLDAKFGTAAQTIPVMVTEFGWNNDSNYSDGVTKGTTTAWGRPFRNYLDAHPEIGWTSYIFDNYWKPQYFDWSWNLMSGDNQGLFMQQWFDSIRVAGQPQPAALTAYGVSTSAVNLSWPADTAADRYVLRRSTVAAGPYVVVDTNVSAEVYADTGLSVQTSYYYTVSPVYGGVEGTASAVAGATTDSVGFAPDLPFYLTYSAADSRVALNWWQAGVGAGSYRVYRADAAAGPYAMIASGLVGTNYADSGLLNGHTYYYRITSMGAKESAPSFVVQDAPSNIYVYVDNAAAVTTGTWSNSTSAPGYYGTNYMHDGNAGATGGKRAQFSPNLPVAGLYDVSMRWTSGINRASNVPVDVNYAGGTMTTRLNQQVDNGVWKYLGSFDFNAGVTGNVTIRNDSANGYVIADGVRFVINPADVSAQSAVPDSLTAVAPSGTQVQVSWRDRSVNESGFIVERALDSLFSLGVTDDTVGANVVTMVDTALAPATTYYYRVKAYNVHAVSGWSGVVVVTTPAMSGSGLIGIVKDHLLTMYPNPASSSMTISGVPSGCRQIVVYDIKGVRRIVIVPNQDGVVTVDVSGLQPGVYVVLAMGDMLKTGLLLKK